MGIIGKNTKSIRKKSLSNTRNPVVGVKSIKFHHETNSGETYIDLSNLVVPSGFVNPSPAEIAKAKIKDFSENLILMSSARPGPLMEGLSYDIVSNTTIKLKFETYQGEIFTGVFYNHVTNGTVIADVRTPGKSGTLPEAATDFALGEAIPIDDLSNQYPIVLFRNGTRQLRNPGNGTSGGDYQMLDNGDGFSSVIRFNSAGGVGGEPVEWSARGALGERPNLSVLQSVDALNGIVDKIANDALVGFGFDVTDPNRYNGIPTNPDLKAFGDRVLELEKIFKVPVVSKLSISSVKSPSGTLGTSVTNGNIQIASTPNLGLIASFGDTVFNIDNGGVDGATRFIAINNDTYFDMYFESQNSLQTPLVIKDKNGTTIFNGTKPYAALQEANVAGSVKLQAGEWITFGIQDTTSSLAGDISFSVSAKVKELIGNLI